MKSIVVTDIELRSRWYANRTEKLTVPCGAVLTPAAKDFIRENNITLIFGSVSSGGSFTITPIPKENGRNVFYDAATGQKLYEKKENAPEDTTGNENTESGESVGAIATVEQSDKMADATSDIISTVDTAEPEANDINNATVGSSSDNSEEA